MGKQVRRAPCADCGKFFPEASMREKVELYSRTLGHGGTLSDVRLQRRTGERLCDSCMKHREHGTNRTIEREALI